MFLNKLQLIGRLTADPQVRYTTSSLPVCTFTVATSLSYTKNSDKKESVEFHQCEAWDKLAESIAHNLSKGALVYLEGRVKTDSWDGECGKKHYRTKVIVQTCSFGPKSVKAVEQVDPQEVPVAEREPGADDDVPF